MWHISFPQAWWLLLLLPVLWWSLRGLPQVLPLWRFIGVVMTRHMLFAMLLLSVAGIGWARMIPRDPVVVYVVDRSSSIDDQERSWQRQRLVALESGLADNVDRHLMTFAGRTRTIGQWKAGEAIPQRVIDTLTADRVSPALVPERTDVQGALLTGLAMATDDQPKRLVLLSDGIQTDGKALFAATVSRTDHVPIFAYAPPAIQQTDVALTKIMVPQIARQDEPVSIRLGLENTSTETVTAHVVVQGNAEVIFDERVRVPVGKHLVDVTAQVQQLGSYQLQARIAVNGDTVDTNNTRATAFEVIGPPRLLLLSGNRLQVPYVAQVLASRNIVVDVRDRAGMPDNLGQLAEYDGVILANFPRSTLTPTQSDLLRRYVQELGGGLVVMGVGGRMGDEVRAMTPLDVVLPARWTLDAPQERETHTRLSVIIVVDRSSSMSGQRILLTKHGAVELVKQLDANDLLGVIAFDTRPHVIVPLQQVAHVRRTIVERLVTINAGGGTYFLPALVAAKNFVARTDAKTKHVILLSDGNTQDPNSPLYKRFAQEAHDQGVTVSTMAIGSAFVRVELLRALAHATGGTFYHITREEEIPQIIVADTQRMLTRTPFAEGWYRPRITQAHEILGDIRETQLPPLKGYLVMEAKLLSTTSLHIESDQKRQDPLLTHWQAGLGRVAMFASDGEARWSAPWIHWDQYQQFWRQVVTWTMRSISLHELTAAVQLEGDTPMLSVHVPTTSDTVEQFTVRLIPLADPEASFDVALTQVTGHQWRTALDSITPGVYQALFLQMARGTLVGEARRWITIDAPSMHAEAESPTDPPQVDLLRTIAEKSGGALDPDTATIIGTDPAQRVIHQWDGWLIPMFLLIFLVDVALRGETLL